MGNGLTVPLAQYPEYSTLAYNWTMEKLGKPVITLETYKQMRSELAVCLPAIAACTNDTAVCALAQSICNNAQIGPCAWAGALLSIAPLLPPRLASSLGYFRSPPPSPPFSPAG